MSKPFGAGKKWRNDPRLVCLQKEMMATGRYTRSMLKCGFARSTAYSGQTQTYCYYKDMKKDTIQKLKEKREMILEHISEEKAKKADISKLASSLEKVNNVLQLLSGGVTERVAYVITEGDEETVHNQEVSTG
jgi:hypothetical protein